MPKPASTLSPSQSALQQLQTYESRNITFIDPGGGWPIVWDRAQGNHVWDLEGRKYLDLTAAFGVAAAGHANPAVVRAGQKQMARLLHAMGDVHPHPLKGRLARELSALTFERWIPAPSLAGSEFFQTRAKTIFCNSGFEAVEAALKTALLATGRKDVVTFTGAYHGLGYGALNATHRPFFRNPFLPQLAAFGHPIPFPATNADLNLVERKLNRLRQTKAIGAILVEPIQARGGIRIPPRELLPLLSAWSRRHGALLILDEVFTGFGRSGKWFACEHSQTIPDLICLGKALTGGFPLSACVGRADLMDQAWPKTEGEALHTSTFLGHPVGCAMALAQIQEIRDRNLVAGSAALGEFLLNQLAKLQNPPDLRLTPRGLGLMAGLELSNPDGSPATSRCLDLIKNGLRHGLILLPEGDSASVIGFTPPLTITRPQIASAIQTLKTLLPRSK